ncbi:MAG: MmgE/PrpD family protein, partial [Victivallales bacterium]|nr:MmgE/PrpD family protein [Victivallales bacterium]
LFRSTRKVQVCADDELSRAFPKLQSAIVDIHTADRTFTERVDFPKGEPENPLTDQEFRSRYDALMEYGGIAPSTAATVFQLAEQPNTLVDELLAGL